VPNGGPVSPFAGSFDITFDNSADIADTSVGLSNVSLPFVLSSGTAQFTYSTNYFGIPDVLFIGGSENGVIGINGSTNDFYLGIGDASSGTPILAFFVYHTTDVFPVIAEAGTFTFTPSVTEVPAPAALALFGAGLLGLGALRRRAVA
jgi:hypothetical protein